MRRNMADAIGWSLRGTRRALLPAGRCGQRTCRKYLDCLDCLDCRYLISVGVTLGGAAIARRSTAQCSTVDS